MYVCVCVLNSTGYNSAASCIHMLYFLPLIGNKRLKKHLLTYYMKIYPKFQLLNK